MDGHKQLVVRLKKLQVNTKVQDDTILREIVELLLSVSDPNFNTTQQIKLQVMKLERSRLDKEIRRLSVDADDEEEDSIDSEKTIADTKETNIDAEDKITEDSVDTILSVNIDSKADLISELKYVLSEFKKDKTIRIKTDKKRMGALIRLIRKNNDKKGKKEKKEKKKKKTKSKDKKRSPYSKEIERILSTELLPDLPSDIAVTDDGTAVDAVTEEKKESEITAISTPKTKKVNKYEKQRISITSTTEEVTEEVKEEVTEEVKEEVTEEAKEEVTEEVKEEVKEEAVEEEVIETSTTLSELKQKEEFGTAKSQSEADLKDLSNASMTLEVLRRLQEILEKGTDSPKIKVLKRPTLKDKGTANTLEGAKTRLSKEKIRKIKKESKDPEKVRQTIEKIKSFDSNEPSTDKGGDKVQINFYVN